MYLKKSKTIVIKIGSSILIDNNKKIRKNGLVNLQKILAIYLNKKNIILVCSGAIALGCKKLNLVKKLKIDKSQAVASIGQIELMNLLKKHLVQKKLISLKFY